MIQERTILKVADNSGAKVVRCFRILGRHEPALCGCGRYHRHVGAIGGTAKTVKKKDVVKVLVVRTKNALRRKDGSYVRFDENAVILVDAKKEPVATRIFGPLPRELKEKGFEKLMTMAEEIV